MNELILTIVKVPDGVDVLYNGRVYPFIGPSAAISFVKSVTTDVLYTKGFSSWEIGKEPEGAFKHGELANQEA